MPKSELEKKLNMLKARRDSHNCIIKVHVKQFFLERSFFYDAARLVTASEKRTQTQTEQRRSTANTTQKKRDLKHGDNMKLCFIHITFVLNAWQHFYGQ